MKRILIFFLIIFLLTKTLKGNSEWITLWGKWEIVKNKNICIKNTSWDIPSYPPEAINVFNALLLKEKVLNLSKIKIMIKIKELLKKNKKGIAGVVFDLKNGNNFYLVYLKRYNDKSSLILCKSYKKGNAYKFAKIEEKILPSFPFNKWYTLEIRRRRSKIIIYLNFRKIIERKLKPLVRLNRICLINLNTEVFFKDIVIKGSKGETVNFNKDKLIKIKSFYIRNKIEEKHNSLFF